MRPRNLLLAAIGTVVVVGGIYLFLDVRGSDASQPSAEKVAAAQARHASSGARPGGRELDLSRGDRVQVRPPRADSFGAQRGGGVPRPREDLPGMAAFNPPPPPLDDSLPDRLRPEGAVQPAIDPDQPELASAMTETNKMYDRGDYDGARTMAYKLLEQQPGNVRMLRVIVSSSCIMGDSDVATKYWAMLPEQDQTQMSVRCARYQVSFPAPKPKIEK